MTNRERLARGEFNRMSQERQPDGSVLVTMTKRGDLHKYELWVKDLYGPDEQVLRESIEEV
ncbi:MAG: hypothetical protein PHQ43_11635 [Dehalococcoidales bacterium]|nr:hypothetical protein [Dehalococcoidales bacterium]